MYRLWLTISYSLLILLSVSGQQESKYDKGGLFVSLSSGGVYYVGDLKDNQLPDGQYMSVFFMAGCSYDFPGRMAIRLDYSKGRLKGADQWGNSNPERDFRFRSPLDDLGLLLSYDLLGKETAKKVQVDIQGGLGYFWFRPEVYNGYWTDAHSLGTEGQYLDGDYPSPYDLSGLNLKYGIEVGYQFLPKWKASCFWTQTHTFTDYIDDVSGDYPDPIDLMASEGGSELSGFTYRYLDGHLPITGAARGNSSLKDGFVHIGIRLSYRIKTFSFSKGNELCPAYR